MEREYIRILDKPGLKPGSVIATQRPMLQNSNVQSGKDER